MDAFSRLGFKYAVIALSILTAIDSIEKLQTSEFSMFQELFKRTRDRTVTLES